MRSGSMLISPSAIGSRSDCALSRAVRRSAAVTRASSSRMEKGLLITSSAPSESTSTRSCSLVRALTTMIGRRGDHSRAWRMTCQPSAPGSIRSSTTASGAPVRRARRPASPSEAIVASKPAARMWKPIASAVLSSSSTISTLIGRASMSAENRAVSREHRRRAVTMM